VFYCRAGGVVTYPWRGWFNIGGWGLKGKASGGYIGPWFQPHAARACNAVAGMLGPRALLQTPKRVGCANGKMTDYSRWPLA
jgi:hypothetical protein